MSTENNIETALKNIVTKTAKKLNITNFKITLNIGEQAKNGFTGEIYKASLENTDTHEVNHLVIKRSFDVNEKEHVSKMMTYMYTQEIYYYSNVVTAYNEFQKKLNLKNVFNPLPKCLLVSNENPYCLVFEDLFKKNYKLWPKQLQLPEDHLVYIFKMYGKLHGLSFVYKKHNREKYDEFAKNLQVPEDFQEFAKVMSEKAVSPLQEVRNQLDEEIAKKLDKYLTNIRGVMESMEYLGDYSCIIHGDSWSNNFMFRYSETVPRQLKDISILDWQVCHTASPVFDLSYLLYAGGTKEDFDKLDYYLKIYHKSLSSFMSEFGEDSSVLFPYEALKNEWHEYGIFGFILALIVMRVKLVSDEETKDAMTDKTFTADMFDGLKYDTRTYQQRLIDLIVHLHEIDVL